MQITRIEKKVVAVVAGLAIAGSVAASAASLGGLASDSLGADTGEVGACDTDGIDVEYTNSFDVARGEYLVDTVTLSDIALECLLRPYEFSIFQKGAGGARQVDGGPALFFTPYNRSQNGGVDMVGRKEIPVSFPAEDLEGVAMYISGQQIGL